MPALLLGSRALALLLWFLSLVAGGGELGGRCWGVEGISLWSPGCPAVRTQLVLNSQRYACLYLLVAWATTISGLVYKGELSWELDTRQSVFLSGYDGVCLQSQDPEAEAGGLMVLV